MKDCVLFLWKIAGSLILKDCVIFRKQYAIFQGKNSILKTREIDQIFQIKEPSVLSYKNAISTRPKNCF